MSNRSMAKRLQRLETRVAPADKRIYRILFISPEDGSVTGHFILGGGTAPLPAYSESARQSILSRRTGEA